VRGERKKEKKRREREREGERERERGEIKPFFRLNMKIKFHTEQKIQLQLGQLRGCEATNLHETMELCTTGI